MPGTRAAAPRVVGPAVVGLSLYAAIAPAQSSAPSRTSAQAPSPDVDGGVETLDAAGLQPPTADRASAHPVIGAAAPSSGPRDAAAADDGGDLVETIEPGPAPMGAAPSATPTAPQAPADPNPTFRFAGWSLATSALELVPVPRRHDATGVPHDGWTNRFRLFGSARALPSKHFEVVLSGLLSYSLLEQAPSSRAFNGFNGAVRGEADALLRELYVGVYSESVDLRVGQQRIAWGNSELLSVNDVVNARDLRDPFATKAELRQIPTPSARATIALGPTTVDVVLAPYFVPDTYDVYGTNWAAIQPDAPRGLRGLFGLLSRHVDADLAPDFRRLAAQTALPARNLSEPVVSLKFAWHPPGWDFDGYYQYGFDGPFVRIDPLLASALQAADFTTAGLASLTPVLQAMDLGVTPISASYVRRHHAGMDVAVPIGSFVVRGDMGYDSRKVFYTPALTSFAGPAIQGVLGLEYQTGDPSKTFIAEGYGLRILSSEVPELLIYDPTSVGVGALARWPIGGRIGMEPRVLVGVRPATVAFEPVLNWKSDPWTVRVGEIVLGGAAHSFGRYYRANSELFVELELAL